MNAPKVTPEQIELLMTEVQYFVDVVPGTTTTLATAVDKNGFTLAVGISACVSPENFNAEIGKKYAVEDAEKKARSELWKLEGYMLKCKLAA